MNFKVDIKELEELLVKILLQARVHKKESQSWQRNFSVLWDTQYALEFVIRKRIIVTSLIKIVS